MTPRLDVSSFWWGNQLVWSATSVYPSRQHVIGYGPTKKAAIAHYLYLNGGKP